MASSTQEIPPTILVVEDDNHVRFTAVMMVEEAGFAVLEAENADAAIKLLEAHPEIRLVFTDVNMPGSMDGAKLAMYAHRRWPPLKFIIASGKSFPLGTEIPDGAHFHVKPYRYHEIERSIAALL